MAGESVSFQDMGDAIVATVLSSEITPEASDALQQKVREERDRQGAVRLVLDLSRITFIGSVSLGALVLLLKRVSEGDGRLALAGLNAPCRRVLQVVELTRIFDLHDDVPSALEAVRRTG
jgi:anti-sigma B factor antagonist